MSALLGTLASPRAMLALRLAAGILLLASGLAKVGDGPWLAVQVHNFHLAPRWAEHAIAIVLPWIELAAGLALVIGVRARAGAVVALALMLVFTLAVAAAWARGLDFRCGCFGKAGAGVIGATKFFENVGLSLLAGLAARRRVDPAPPAAPAA
jgi:uncharacterized membrane protein YphA (DoxX/SURF4 family)